jgi:hypothetical protein
VWGGATGLNNSASTYGFTQITQAGPNVWEGLKNDGSIVIWGTVVPTSTAGFVFGTMANTYAAYASLRSDGSIATWGAVNSGVNGTPTDTGYISVVGNYNRFSALKADGSIRTWYGAGVTTGAPTGIGFKQISTVNDGSFAAIRPDGSIATWGAALAGNAAPSTGITGFKQIYSNETAFAALKTDGSIYAWGTANWHWLHAYHFNRNCLRRPQTGWIDLCLGCFR